MPIPGPHDALEVSIAKRIMNELDTKNLNQKNIRKVDDVKVRNTNSPDYSDMLFHCECDDANCEEIITLPTLVYERAHINPIRFIVKNSHVKTDIEKVIERYNSYTIVEKLFVDANKKELSDAQSKRRREENEVIFRDSNDAIKDVVKNLLPMTKNDVSLRFTCECSNEDCEQNIEMTISAYEELRKNNREFIVKVGHEQKDIERVVHHAAFNVVEKFNEPPKTDGILKQT